jgi:hypothetical protein
MWAKDLVLLSDLLIAIEYSLWNVLLYAALKMGHYFKLYEQPVAFV